MSTGNGVEQLADGAKRQNGDEIGSVSAARIMGVHPVTVLVWAKKGWIPAWRTPGGRFRFSKAALEQWKRSHPAEEHAR